MSSPSRTAEGVERRKERARSRYRENREREIARVQAYHAADIGRRDLANLKFRLKAYGLTLDEFMEIKERQAGVCALCEKPETRTSKNGRTFELVVDHDHATGRVRGLLCHSCNVAIGHLRDDPLLAFRAADYLLSSGKGEAKP